MKVKTNLSPVELYRVGTGLQKAAKQPSELVIENPAEDKLLQAIDHIFTVAATNLAKEIEYVLKE